MTSTSSVHEARYSKPVLWDNPEGWAGDKGGGGSGCGTHVYPWLIHVTGWQKPQ